MKVAIVSNFNGIGLQRDFEIVSDLLTELGHEVTGIQFDAPREDEAFVTMTQQDYGLTVFLEVLPVDLVRLSPVNWIFANPEWVRPEMVKLIERHCDKVFAKTLEAQRIFEPLWPGKVFYIGFSCRDQYDTSVERTMTFLHIGGNSSLRGTKAVMDAWRWKKNGARLEQNLIVVSTLPDVLPDDQLPNVVVMPKINEELLKKLQNSCLFHVYPSGTEGYGHALHESESVGAIVLTTNAPPMNEMEGVMRIPVAPSTRKFHLADVYDVSALDIYEAVEKVSQCAIWDDTAQCWYAPADVPIQTRANWHDLFLTKNAEFRTALATHLQDVKPKRTPRKKSKDVLDIAFLGNFANVESTENMIQWALTEGLGHQVEKLQENAVRLHDIREATEFSDLLIWVRTPGFLKVPNEQMEAFLKETLSKTVSIHLDKFWGIPERERLIGVHPFFKTDWVFTADGSRDEDFAARGVHHVWMRPAVSEVYCHPGIPRDEYLCDVGFVGARDYHAEYPFRGEMVSFLERTYGERFKHVTGVRGHLLNDVYASMKVVVGDCIFAGVPNYWSDRLPETSGRCGFLLHPEIKGLDKWPGAKYKPQDLSSLQREIEFWLDSKYPTTYRVCKQAAFDHIRFNHTWTKRMKEILGKVLND